MMTPSMPQMTPKLQAQAMAMTAKRPAPSFRGGGQNALAAMPLSQSPGLIRSLDYSQLGTSAVAQNKLIYALVIASRAMVGATRSKNEVREVLLRDPLGWAFWFYATPLLLRLYLMGVTRKNDVMKKALLIEKDAIEPTAKGGFKRMLQNIARVTHSFNPLQRYGMPSTKQLAQVRDQMKEEMVQVIRKTGNEIDHKALHQANTVIEQLYNKAIVHRNLATGVGILTTIGLLGIGINLINFWLTRKSIEEKQKAQQAKLEQQGMSAVTPPMSMAPPSGMGMGYAYGYPQGAQNQNQNPFARQY